MTTNRRDFLSWSTHGLTATALMSLLQRDGSLSAADAVAKASQPPTATPGEAHDPPPHLGAKCKRVIHIFLCGGMSHLDSFDYKPLLEKYHGQPLPSTEKPETFFGKIGLIRKNDWEFQQRGESGLWVSDLFPHIAGVADELTVIRSMIADSANHTPATFQANTGFRLNGFPVLGSWLSYGLGCETDDLPAYVVLPIRAAFRRAGRSTGRTVFFRLDIRESPFGRRGIRLMICFRRGPDKRGLTPGRTRGLTSPAQTAGCLTQRPSARRASSSRRSTGGIRRLGPRRSLPRGSKATSWPPRCSCRSRA